MNWIWNKTETLISQKFRCEWISNNLCSKEIKLSWAPLCFTNLPLTAQTFCVCGQNKAETIHTKQVEDGFPSFRFFFLWKRLKKKTHPKTAVPAIDNSRGQDACSFSFSSSHLLPPHFCLLASEVCDAQPGVWKVTNFPLPQSFKIF